MRPRHGDGAVTFGEETRSNGRGASNSFKRNAFDKDVNAKVDLVQKACILARNVAVVIRVERGLTVL